jgi:hypothetical protein
MVPLGQKSENFCGATQIDEKIVRSATCHHTPFPGNGGKARRYLLGAVAPFSPPSAVHSAKSSLLPSHHRQLAGRNSFCVLVCVIGFVLFELELKFTTFFWICQALLFMFLVLDYLNIDNFKIK